MAKDFFSKIILILIAILVLEAKIDDDDEDEEEDDGRPQIDNPAPIWLNSVVAA